MYTYTYIYVYIYIYVISTLPTCMLIICDVSACGHDHQCRLQMVDLRAQHGDLIRMHTFVGRQSAPSDEADPTLPDS